MYCCLHNPIEDADNEKKCRPGCSCLSWLFRGRGFPHPHMFQITNAVLVSMHHKDCPLHASPGADITLKWMGRKWNHASAFLHPFLCPKSLVEEPYIPQSFPDLFLGWCNATLPLMQAYACVAQLVQICASQTQEQPGRMSCVLISENVTSVE